MLTAKSFNNYPYQIRMPLKKGGNCNIIEGYDYEK